MEILSYYLLRYFFFTGKGSKKKECQTLSRSYDTKESALKFAYKAKDNPYIEIISLNSIIETEVCFKI